MPISHHSREKVILFFLLLMLFQSSLITSQQKYNFDLFKDDFNKIIEQPSKWNSNDLLLLFGSAVITYGTMQIDGNIRKSIIQNNKYSNSIPIEFGRIWGEPWFVGSLGLGLYFLGTDDESSLNRKIGFEIIESSIYSVILTGIIKIGSGRERPSISSDPFNFHPFFFGGFDYRSFSSGHTALAFSASTILAQNTSNDFLKIAAYLPAFMTAFSRVYQNQHWASDVILGGIIGYTVAKFVEGLHKKRIDDDEVELSPIHNYNLISYKINF